MNGSYESLTSTTAVKTLTATKYRVVSVLGSGSPAHTVATVIAEEALVTVETNSIRWTVDGTTPSTTVGHLAAAGDVIDLEGFDAIRKFQFTRASADGAIHVTYFA
jgi:hypothetical protein